MAGGAARDRPRTRDGAHRRAHRVGRRTGRFRRRRLRRGLDVRRRRDTGCRAPLGRRGARGRRRRGGADGRDRLRLHAAARPGITPRPAPSTATASSTTPRWPHSACATGCCARRRRRLGRAPRQRHASLLLGAPGRARDQRAHGPSLLGPEPPGGRGDQRARRARRARRDRSTSRSRSAAGTRPTPTPSTRSSSRRCWSSFPEAIVCACGRRLSFDANGRSTPPVARRRTAPRGGGARGVGARRR